MNKRAAFALFSQEILDHDGSDVMREDPFLMVDTTLPRMCDHCRIFEVD